MEVPLTESGQFDDSHSHSLDEIPWATIKRASPLSETGSKRGVVVVELIKSKVVIKSSQEPAREMFLTRLCRHLGVSAPGCRFLVVGTPEYDTVVRKVRGVINRPVLVLQQFVVGSTLSNMSRSLSQRFFSCSAPKTSMPVLRALGRIMALDVFCNNWDRIPLIHDNSGNLGNVILQHSETEGGRLVAIDNAMTGIRREVGPKRNPQYDVYLNKVMRLLDDILAAGPRQACAAVRRVLGAIPVNMGPEEGVVVQTGLAEMFVRLAKFDRFAEEKETVQGMGPAWDPWYAADLERIDLDYLGDMHRLVRSRQDELLRVYQDCF